MTALRSAYVVSLRKNTGCWQGFSWKQETKTLTEYIECHDSHVAYIKGKTVTISKIRHCSKRWLIIAYVNMKKFATAVTKAKNKFQKNNKHEQLHTFSSSLKYGLHAESIILWAFTFFPSQHRVISTSSSSCLRSSNTAVTLFLKSFHFKQNLCPSAAIMHWNTEALFLETVA